MGSAINCKCVNSKSIHQPVDKSYLKSLKYSEESSNITEEKEPDPIFEFEFEDDESELK